jgi:hypothetical protein
MRKQPVHFANINVHCFFEESCYLNNREIKKREDNIKMDLKVIGREGVDWIRLAQEGTGGGLL